MLLVAEQGSKRSRNKPVFELIKNLDEQDSSQLNRFKFTTHMEEMLEIVQEGPNKGKSGLWFIVFNKKFDKIWEEKLISNLSFRKALFSKCENGSNKGESAFSMLFNHEDRYNNTSRFGIKILEMLHAEMTIEELINVIENIKRNKADCLRFVKGKFQRDTTLEEFLPVLNRLMLLPLGNNFKANIFYGFFKEKDLSWYASNKVMSALSVFLSLGLHQETPVQVKHELLNLFKQLKLRPEFLVTPFEENGKQQTLLAHTASLPDFNLFLYFFRRFNISFENISNPVSSILKTMDSRRHTDYYKNAVNLLVEICEKFKKNINFAALIEGDHIFLIAMMCVLGNHAVKPEQCAVVYKIIKKIFQQEPGVIPSEIFDKEYYKLYLGSLFSTLDIFKLIDKRNALFSYMAEIKDQMLIEETYNHLMVRAKDAFDAGYLNAFYDASSLVGSEQRHEVLENVPPKSCHFQEVVYTLAEHYYIEFIKGSKNCLTKALGYALKINDTTSRNYFLQKIGYYVISGERPKKGVQPAREALIPEDLLPAFNEMTPLITCGVLFSEIKRKKRESLPTPPVSSLTTIPAESTFKMTWSPRNRYEYAFAEFTLRNGLFKAIQDGNLNEVSDLIGRGVNPNFHQNDMCYTPLQLASELGHGDIANCLITKGAEPDLQDISLVKCTALHYAALNNYPELVMLLHRANANMNKLDRKGKTPFYYAVNAGAVEATKALLKLPTVAQFPSAREVLASASEVFRNQLLADEEVKAIIEPLLQPERELSPPRYLKRKLEEGVLTGEERPEKKARNEKRSHESVDSENSEGDQRESKKPRIAK